MTTYKFLPNNLTEEDKNWYTKVNKGYEATGDCLKASYFGKYQEGSCTYVIFKGDWTRHDTVRDCGDHWIYAGYSSYRRIDKETFKVTEDVEDR